jgi:hypothetical protein
MKRFLFILLVLGIAVPAGADSFVYNLKISDTGVKWNGGEWKQQKESEGGFLVIEPNGSGAIDVWAVWLWKTGDGQKSASPENWGNISLTQADVPAGKKTKSLWLISDVDVNFVDPVNRNRRIMLTGDRKPTKISSCSKCHDSSEMATFDDEDISPNIAASLAGYAIWDDTLGDPVYYRKLTIRTMSLKLNTKVTLEAHTGGNFKVEDAVNGILDDLYDAGYEVSYP